MSDDQLRDWADAHVLRNAADVLEEHNTTGNFDVRQAVTILRNMADDLEPEEQCKT